MSIQNIEKFITEKTNFPLKDRHDLPSSKVTFEGGAHYRMEIAGIENAENFEVLIKEAANPQDHWYCWWISFLGV